MADGGWRGGRKGAKGAVLFHFIPFISLSVASVQGVVQQRYTFRGAGVRGLSIKRSPWRLVRAMTSHEA